MRCGSRVKFNAKGLPISHHNSHFMGRRKEATRFEPLNCDTLCHGCHAYFTAHPALHAEWQVKRKGQVLIDKLVLLSNTTKKKERKLEAIYWKRRILTDYGVKI
jgi:hypothetical protein